MPTEVADGFDSVLGSFAAPWIGFWQCAAILGRASLEGAALFWGLGGTGDQSLATLGQTMDRYMRTPPFLVLMQQSLKMLSRPTCLGFPVPMCLFPVRFFQGESAQ
jgi:hypothetical protein